MEHETLHAVRKLEDSQVESFDIDYVVGGRWDLVRGRIASDFPDGRFSFLDVGGGNGRFADLLLAEYPLARGTVIDNSEVLIKRNAPNPRKTTICESAEHLNVLGERYDVICVHWLLHHLVGESYQKTRQNQVATLRNLAAHLNPRGRISVFENLPEGWVFKSLPGRMIYELTSSRALAGVTRRLGANSGGTGVCYLTDLQWRATIEKAGLRVYGYGEPDDWVWPLRPLYRVALHMRAQRVGHFWLGLPASHS